MQRHTEEIDSEGHGEQQMQSQSGRGVWMLSSEEDCGRGLEQCNDAEER